MNRAFGDESIYYKRRREDELKYLIARPADGVITPFQCDTCWFVNLFDRLPFPGAVADDWNLQLIRRANLDMMWSRDSKGTVGGIKGQLKDIVRRAQKYGRKVPLSPFTPWPIADDEGMGIAITMLEKSIEKGQLSDHYQQFSSVRKLRSAASDVYAATHSASSLRYNLKKTNRVFHLDEGPTQTIFLERMVAGMEARMPKDDSRNLPMNSRMILYILDRLEIDLFHPRSSQSERRLIIMTGSYLVIAYGYSLRGYEGFWVDAKRLCDYISTGKDDDRCPHLIVPLLGRFKSESGDRMHVFPLSSVTNSGIPIRLWVERLVNVLKEEGKVNCPAFCDEEGYQLYASVLEEVYHPILKQMQADPNHKNVIPHGLDVTKWYLLSRSLRRGAENQAVSNGVDDTTVNLVHRWNKYEKARGKQPKGFSMMHYYLQSQATLYRQLVFSTAL